MRSAKNKNPAMPATPGRTSRSGHVVMIEDDGDDAGSNEASDVAPDQHSDQRRRKRPRSGDGDGLSPLADVEVDDLTAADEADEAATAASAAVPTAAVPAATTFRMGHGANDDNGSCQVFSTEFISAMHVDDSQLLGDALVITDTWKQKYNDPIQVPSGNARQVFNPTPRAAAGPKIRRKTRKRPGAYVKFGGVEEGSSNLRYHTDVQDTVWLALHNATKGHTSQLDVGQMEAIMVELEADAHRGLVTAVTDPNTNSKDRSCDVCQLPDSEIDNEMVFCDGCNTLVHQRCYGITAVPEGDWFCLVCDARLKKVPCELCPNLEDDGAFKKTDVAGRWAHVMCALWVPECKFGDPVLMEPILLRDVPVQRHRLQCTVCKVKTGACIQCDEASCTTAFHVTCAMNANLRMEIIVTKTGMVIRRAFCKRHRALHQQLQPGEIKVAVSGGEGRKRRVLENSITTDFCEFIDVPEIAKRTGISLVACKHVYAYWSLKRRGGGGTPLIRELHFKVSEIRKGLGRNQFEAERKSLVALKQSLERARQICGLAKDRESTKRELLELMRAEFVISTNSYALSLKMDESSLLDADITADFIQAERLLLDKDASADPATSITAPAAAGPQKDGVVQPDVVQSESADAPAATRAPRQAAMSAQNKIAALNAVN